MKTRLAVLILGSLTLWVLVAIPARYLWGDDAAIHAAVALLLCLLPAVATLAWAFWGQDQSPETQLVTALGGTGVRMFFVLAAAGALYVLVPYFHQLSFWVWVLGFYLFTLFLEVVLLVAGRSASSAPDK